MGAITKQTLAWAETAPVQNEGTARCSASPEAVWAVLTDQERWPEWFTTLKKVTVTSPTMGVGGTRTVSLPGLSVDEELIAWEPGRLFAFTGVSCKPGMFRELVEQCVIEPSDDGGCQITWKQSLTPGNAVYGAVLKAGRKTLLKSLDAGMTNLARRAEAATT
jgi:ribosome-associated toxin RatA of RatAB toxin-antitoxin module